MEVHHLGSSKWLAERCAKELGQLLPQEEFSSTQYYIAQEIPHDDPDYPEFRFRVVGCTEAELETVMP